MRNSRTPIVGLILVVLAGLAAWLFLKPGSIAEPASEASTKTPPQSSAADSTESRSPQAAAPHETATMPVTQNTSGARLDMRSLNACHDALINKKALQDQFSCDNIPADQTSALNFCRSQQAQGAQQVNEAEAAAASCPPDLLTASAYYEAIKELAQRGDIPAQRCFIQGYFASAAQEGEESRMRKDQTEEYVRLAKNYIDDALARGDWSVVRWLARSRIGLQDFMLSSAYPFGNDHPETAYRMNYLLTLGNRQNFETSVDAHQYVELLKQNKVLTPKQFQDEEDWARNMFDQRFNGSQEGAALTQFCEHS